MNSSDIWISFLPRNGRTQAPISYTENVGFRWSDEDIYFRPSWGSPVSPLTNDCTKEIRISFSYFVYADGWIQVNAYGDPPPRFAGRPTVCQNCQTFWSKF